MRPPKEFCAFCSYLHQESALVYGSGIRDIVRGALRQIPEEDWITLRAYLAGVLAGGYSDAELQELYRSTDAELGIRKGMREFLTIASRPMAC